MSRYSLRLVLPVALVVLLVHLATALPLTARESITNGKQLRILPLGDSITFGWQPENQQGTNGYRAELAQRLSGSNFNFVGTLRSGDMEDNYNEGHSGFTISQIQNVMQPALDMRPNVILLHAGTNDLHNPAPEGEPYSEAPQRLDGFLDAVLQTCPDAVVIVAKLVQAANVDSNARFATYDDAIPGIVQSKIDAGYKVTVVDQSVVGPDELIDGLHPTDAGYAHMGDIWFEAIKAAAQIGLISDPVDADPVQE